MLSRVIVFGYLELVFAYWPDFSVFVGVCALSGVIDLAMLRLFG